ncbi:MAG TPA: hypothetical protein VMF12_20190 [Xanthobacteraceae bacterium]|nr:hypothetical protein [Xanthobacteraceae bacterium]
MRGVGCAASLAAALCGGCTAQAVTSQAVTQQAVAPQSFLPSYQVLSAAHKPAGYYPGYADMGLVDPAGYKAWLAQNQPRIDDIQARIAAIREGRTTSGCIGEDRYTCVATLAQKFAIADYSHDRSIVADAKYDVNGKPLAQSKFEILGYVPRPDIDKKNPDATMLPTHFALKMGSTGKVSGLEIEFFDDPTIAHTQQEYDATDAYDAVSAVTAKKCPNLSRVDVAKWIENTIKPRLKSYRTRMRRGFADHKISKKVAFCGQSFQFSSEMETKTYNQYGPQSTGGGMSLMVD